jgi:argininosuccinate lyase
MAKPVVRRKLWHKKDIVEMNHTVEEYNAGKDIQYDQQLVPYDVVGSIAYAKMLHKYGILNAKELADLEKGLGEIAGLHKAGRFIVTLEDEDCHTAIEKYLVAHYGDVGKKIHTARSRNDQVLVTERLFIRDKLGKIRELAVKAAKEFATTAKKYEFVPMPGYTHTQKAMPSSVGMWLGSFAEGLVDDIRFLDTVAKINNQNPLGTGAGYGTPFGFDRDYLSKLMGFENTQSNSIYCHNSRAKNHSMVLDACVHLMMTLNKFATDIVLFSSGQYRFFEFGDNIATGSSIMPQKKNLDVGELLRARGATVVACRSEILMNYMNKISGYHRDGQELKRPLFQGLQFTQDSLEVASIIAENVTPVEKNLYEAMTPELFATHKAFELVKKGMPFRDAYFEIGNHLKELTVDKGSIVGMLKQSKHRGGAGNLGLNELIKKIKKL